MKKYIKPNFEDISLIISDVLNLSTQDAYDYVGEDYLDWGI